MRKKTCWFLVMLVFGLSAWGQIVSLGVKGRAPDLLVDGSNHFHLCYSILGSGVRYITSANGTTWSTPQSIPDSGNVSPQFSPGNLAVDDAGVPCIVWGRRYDQLYFSRRVGGVWSARQTIVDGGEQNVAYPAITYDSAGKLWLFYQRWYGDSDPRNNIEYITSDNDGQTWSAPTEVISNYGEPRAAEVVADGLALNLVWHASVHFKRYNGTSWSGIQNLGSSAGNPDVNIDGSNHVHVVWTRYGSSSTEAIRYDEYNGVSWRHSRTGLVISPTLNNGFEDVWPQVAADSTGRVVAVWSNNNGSTIQYNSKPSAGASWAGAQTLSTSADAYLQWPISLVSRGEDVYVVFVGQTALMFGPIGGGPVPTPTPTDTPNPSPAWNALWTGEENQLPPNENPSWTLYGGSSLGNCSIADGIMTITDDTAPGGGGGLFSWADCSDIDASVGITMVFRMRKTDSSSESLPTCGEIKTGEAKDAFLLFSDHFGTERQPSTFSVDASQWHIYRVLAHSEGMAVYLDEADDYSLLVIGWNRPDTAKDFIFGFQDWDGTGVMEVDWCGACFSGLYVPGSGPALPESTVPTPTDTPTPTNTPTATVGEKGDMEPDGDFDLFDILRLVDIVLEIPPPPNPHEDWAGDMDDDGDHDLFDILALVDKVLEN